MLGLAGKTDTATTVRNEVAAFLYNAISTENSALSGLDRWTQGRVTDENMAKAALVVEADDPAEYCYQNLVREIDTEAKSRAFRISPARKNEELDPVWTSREARYERSTRELPWMILVSAYSVGPRGPPSFCGVLSEHNTQRNVRAKVSD